MLPPHLKRYVVSQDYSRYTPVDQSVWRYIMRQLNAFLSKHAHACYNDGLTKTGIDVDRIPNIEEMSAKLEKFGWRAIPVSGFIPPAAFMELQAHGYLPIASDLRTVDHIMYTPAPDIVHEAAGHAPILIEPEYAEYLKSYAKVASKAIISREDLDQYEAIRILSDLKEDPSSTNAQVVAAEKKLNEVTSSISHISEAALLGRMNWWTAEYGLIGTLENPRIFGAGLLSSIGEARECLGKNVLKLPLTVECINFSYDITEPQPQLFVTPDFAHLRKVLEQLADRLAFRVGGLEGLHKAKDADSVNTVELESGLQISGRLKSIFSSAGQASYLQFDGPTQLAHAGKELVGHGCSYHAQGFGSPVGLVEGFNAPLTKASEHNLESLGVVVGKKATLRFTSGVVVEGVMKSHLRATTGELLLISFTDCTVTLADEKLFDPSWGVFDMAVGADVVSVFGGPADREAFGETEDFAAKTIPRKEWTPIMKYKHELYQAVRDLREDMKAGRAKRDAATADRLEAIFTKLEEDFPHDWLLRLEILELANVLPTDAWRPHLELQLRNLGDGDAIVKTRIHEGLSVF